MICYQVSNFNNPRCIPQHIVGASNYEGSKVGPRTKEDNNNNNNNNNNNGNKKGRAVVQ